MKPHKKTIHITGLAVASCMAIASNKIHAQTSGSTTLGIGWLRVMPQGTSDPLVMESVAGIPLDIQVPDTSAHVRAASTISLTVEHYLTDNVGVALLAGTPLSAELAGSDSLARYGAIGKATAMSPVLELRYHFLPANAKLRPFVGAGIDYTWYKDIQITNVQFLSCGPGCTAHGSLASSWGPTFEFGVGYALNEHWGINASLSYLPMSTTMKIEAEPVGINVVADLNIKVNPLIAKMNVLYTF
jgi:outer membrane protein